MAAKVRLPDGTELHYIARGAGPAVVFLHGGMGDYESWNAQLDAFAREFNVISYSRRHNHPNRNAAPFSDYSARVDAQDLAGFVQYLGLKRAHLVGTSYGAFAALLFALQAPGSVASLVLAEPPLHGWALEAPGGEVLYRRFMEDVWHPARAAFARSNEACAMRILADGMWGCALFDELAAGRRAMLMRNAPAMRALVLSSDPFPGLARAQAAGLRIPVLLVAGQHAIPLHRLVNAELARVLPMARELSVPEADHGSPRENPTFFNAAVWDFYGCLESQPGGRGVYSLRG